MSVRSKITSAQREALGNIIARGGVVNGQTIATLTKAGELT